MFSIYRNILSAEFPSRPIYIFRIHVKLNNIWINWVYEIFGLCTILVLGLNQFLNVFRLKNPWMIFTRRCVLGHWYRVSEFVFGILIRFLSTYKWSIIWFECKWLVACSCQIVSPTSNWTCPYKLFLFWVLLVGS